MKDAVLRGSLDLNKNPNIALSSTHYPRDLVPSQFPYHSLYQAPITNDKYDSVPSAMGESTRPTAPSSSSSIPCSPTLEDPGTISSYSLCSKRRWRPDWFQLKNDVLSDFSDAQMAPGAGLLQLLGIINTSKKPRWEVCIVRLVRFVWFPCIMKDKNSYTIIT